MGPPSYQWEPPSDQWEPLQTSGTPLQTSGSPLQTSGTPLQTSPAAVQPLNRSVISRDPHAVRGEEADMATVGRPAAGSS
ncbi:unnamed protein product [Arctogadus glacialis]